MKRYNLSPEGGAIDLRLPGEEKLNLKRVAQKGKDVTLLERKLFKRKGIKRYQSH